MSKFESAIVLKAARVWPGLGHWNLYFILKFALQWAGYLNIQVLPNLLFAAFLLVPLGSRFRPVMRQLIAVPLAMALLYQDTWLPPLTQWPEWTTVVDLFSEHSLALAERLVDWNVLGWLLVLVAGYLFIHPWLRLTTLSLVGLAWLGLGNLPALYPGHGADFIQGVAAQERAAGANADIERYLQQFYADEAERRVTFQPMLPTAQPFDLLLINIDSMAWDDLDLLGLRDHPLLQGMDVLFDRFNSAASERVPATLGLLRAGCGQVPRSQLQVPAPEPCLLFDELARQGYVGETLLNHTGQAAGFLNTVQTLGALPAPRMDLSHLQSILSAPDGSPVLRDREVLDLWWKQRLQQPDPRVALFYNTLTLQDGNRIVTAAGQTRRADYKARAQALLEDLSVFLDQLEASGRRVVVVIVPDHGAALRGDRMQFPSMREIPAPSITQVPVGIKLIGMGRNPRSSPLRVSEPSSYLALAQIIDRLYSAPAQVGGQQPDWQPLLTGLAQTPLVSESEGSVVLDYAAARYVRIKENTPWLPYRPVSK
ncbi:cellulose biosynthesis protein BcsG [Pseudomonas sp. RGM2987]|uniref:cellulose biosynthesis protein BcsG n=1 Tax=Pseudomonas sp. RGM2987 TaxID=2930090 RepID=UPI001FD7224F|nr:cellulose biosynthesis protein BcsG [Pseudomonas sp. RGM2987]MCJ8207947.1 cellulose biosynthesis protein BcsG [Pseudomonas sp. RGM2987]